MSETIFDPSCTQVDAQLALYIGYKPTIMCGLYIPELGEVALVRPWGAFYHETPDQALRPVQTVCQPGEAAGEAFVRKVTSELKLSTDALYTVYGLAADSRAMTAGHKENKRAFGLLCGVVEGQERPALYSTTDKNEGANITAKWYTFAEAEERFRIQQETNVWRRGKRNLRHLLEIRELGKTLGHNTGI